MSRYSAIGMAVPILFGVSVIVFLLMNVLPGSAEAGLVSEDMSAAERQAIRDELGLNDPLPVRYLHWLGDALHGDLGYSAQRRRDVSDLLVQAWSNTVVLAVVSAVFGISLGLLARLPRRHPAGQAGRPGHRRS